MIGEIFCRLNSGALLPVMRAIKDWAEWVGEVARAIGEAGFDLIHNLVDLAGTIVSDVIKFVLYLINKALFAIYRSFRDILMLQGYCVGRPQPAADLQAIGYRVGRAAGA